ncbi:MAG: sterol desaturase family protein, partial [Ferruginibacter sp.]
MLERIVHYFQTLEQHPLQRMAFLVGGLLFFWMIESAIPLLQLTYKKNKLQHSLVNFTFTIFHLIIHTF